MDSIPAPFTTATPSACKRAWTGGNPFPPAWERNGALQCIDYAGFHALVRAAGLPEAELRHMGFKPHVLASAACGAWIGEEVAVPLLGRIAWDASAGNWFGEPWAGLPHQLEAAQRLGSRVVGAWFR